MVEEIGDCLFFMFALCCGSGYVYTIVVYVVFCIYDMQLIYSFPTKKL